MAEQTQLLENGTVQLAPRTGTSFVLKRGERLIVIDPCGKQVADLIAYNATDTKEALSNGRTFDYNGTIYLGTGNRLYSNCSNVLLDIVDDTVGRHDFLFTPCSKDTFRLKYGVNEKPHHGCFGNFAHALKRFGIEEHQITIPFNCFMNVPVNGETGTIEVKAPTSRAGDHIDFVAAMDVIIGLTACSAERSNDGNFKPIQYRIERASTTT